MLMTARRRIDKNILAVVAAGFGLAILLLLVSAYVGIQAMELVEERGTALHERQRMSTRLIDEIQGEEAGLSSIFYALVAGSGSVSRDDLSSRLTAIEQQVTRTLAAAARYGDAQRWEGVKVAVAQFIAQVRTLLSSPAGRDPPPSLYAAHESLANELANLVAADWKASIEEDLQQGRSGRERLRQSLVLLGIALLLSVLCAAATVLVAARVFYRLEWQSAELSRLSTHVLEGQEAILHRFSRELHDEFGQILTAIEANIAAIPRSSSAIDARVEDCLLLVKDAMANVRELSQLLRPSTLDDFGLAPSLQNLADSFSQRTGIDAEQHIEFNERLPGEIETHLFRIAQEALTNVARHSGATSVRLSLVRKPDSVVLSIHDNGRGLPAGKAQSGFGLIGMRERIRAAHGDLRIQSSPQGVTVIAEVPLDGVQQNEADPSLARG
jgi:signal transduction histidine kinase